MLTIQAYSSSPFDLEIIKTLFKEYNTFIGIDLAFQAFEAEMATLPGRYVPNEGGELYLACWKEQPIGCASFYAFDKAAGIAEVKRVFVRPQGQGKGVGRALMQRIIADAPHYEVKRFYLDSLRRLGPARVLYEKLGFVDIKPYNQNPYDDVYYMEKVI